MLLLTDYRKTCIFCNKIKIDKVGKLVTRFLLINLTRTKVGDHRKLFHILDLTLIQLQYRYLNEFTYLQLSRNLMVSMMGINARLTSV